MEKTLDRQELFTYVLVAISFLLAFVWFSFPPPLFEGIPKLVCIAYFLALSGVSVSSFIWLQRHNRGSIRESALSGTKRRMLILLIVSILFLMASAFLLIFALAVSGLLKMI
jgi:hypothetical protein